MEETKTYTLEEVVAAMYDFSEYSEKEKEIVIEETTSMITEAALLRSLDDAPEEIQNAFSDLLATEPDDIQVMEFIQKNIPEFETYISQEVEIFANMDNENKNT